MKISDSYHNYFLLQHLSYKSLLWTGTVFGAMVVREAFFLGVFFGRLFGRFQKLAFSTQAFFSRLQEIGVFFLAFFLKEFENWRFPFGRFFFIFQKLAFFSWRFFGRFFLAFFLGVFWMVSFFKLISSKKGRFFWAFFWAFFLGVFFDEFRKLAFFSWRFLGVFFYF